MKAALSTRVRRAARIGILGGTFDPVHNGHLAVARAALRRYRLDRIYFVPSGIPPHKPYQRLTPFLHRYTMVALACAGEPRFVPSLLEAGRDLTGRERCYSIDTVRRLRRLFPRARLYFILGADQFLTLRSWKNHRALVRLCDFIVATRPGFRLSAGRAAEIAPGARLHWLTAVQSQISASRIRQLVRAGQARSWQNSVPPAVADYIRALGLYSRRWQKGM